MYILNNDSLKIYEIIYCTYYPVKKLSIIYEFFFNFCVYDTNTKMSGLITEGVKIHILSLSDIC